ncbi:MAG: hypothetical protein WCO12_02740 [bacterium]
MNLKNLLDLRKKVSPQIQIVEKIVLQKRSWKTEAFRLIAVIAIVSTAIYGITRADTLVQQSHVHAKNVSAIGTVSNIGDSTISINDAKSSDDTGATSYTFDTSYITTIQTNHFLPLTLSDIKVGDNIILQGTEKDGATQILRIFSYGTEPATGILTPEVSPTTDATSTASTILQVLQQPRQQVSSTPSRTSYRMLLTPSLEQHLLQLKTPPPPQQRQQTKQQHQYK